MTIKEYDNKVTAIVSEADKKIEQYEQRLTELSAEISAAEQGASAALDACNVSNFRKAKKQAGELETEANMLNKRVDALRNDPLISEEEYKQIISGIRSECDDLTDKALRAICDLVNKINEIGQEQVDIIIEADSVLDKLRIDVFRDPDGMRSRKCGVEVGAYDGLHVARACYDIGYWRNDIVNHPMYLSCAKKFAGQEDD